MYFHSLFNSLLVYFPFRHPVCRYRFPKRLWLKICVFEGCFRGEMGWWFHDLGREWKFGVLGSLSEDIFRKLIEIISFVDEFSFWIRLGIDKSSKTDKIDGNWESLADFRFIMIYRTWISCWKWNFIVLQMFREIDDSRKLIKSVDFVDRLLSIATENEQKSSEFRISLRIPNCNIIDEVSITRRKSLSFGKIYGSWKSMNIVGS